MEAAEKKLFQAIHRDIRALLDKEKKESWVRAIWIQRLTGWNAEQMRQARRDNIIAHRVNDNGGIEYLLESLPEQFIIHKTQTNAKS